MDKYVPVPNIMVREFERMVWVDPKQALINLRRLETNLPADLDEQVRRLRTNKLKELREARIAALFAFGTSDQVLNVPVLVSKSEAHDFDFVAKWQTDEKHYF